MKITTQSKIFFVNVTIIAILILGMRVSIHAAPPKYSKEIKTHLEFLGYSSEIKEEFMISKHHSKTTIKLRQY